MSAITFSEAAKLKSYIWEHFKVNLHIHDTCGGGLFFSIDEVNEMIINFLIEYFKARGIETEISKDRLSIFISEERKQTAANLSVVYEKENLRSAAYDKDRLIGECLYEERNGNWVITHTYVKESYRNQSIAKLLVLLILNEALKEKIRVVPECSYAKKLMESN